MINERCKKTLIDKLQISDELATSAVGAGLTSVLRVRNASTAVLVALGFTLEQVDAIKSDS